MSEEERIEGGIITMVVSGGLFILGKLIGENKLCDPRVFQIIKNGAEMQLSPLPGTPSFIIVGLDGLKYPLPETQDNKNLFELYHRVTHPQPLPTVGESVQVNGNVVKFPIN